MLMRTDPFRELDRLTQQVFANTPGTWSRPTAMPMDAYRAGDQFVVAFDLPGVSPDAIELDVERNVLTVKADTLDTEHIDAAYDAGVLTLRIPIAEKAKPRKISITNTDSGHKQINV
jgi:HSP20 family protein